MARTPSSTWPRFLLVSIFGSILLRLKVCLVSSLRVLLAVTSFVIVLKTILKRQFSPSSTLALINRRLNL